MANGKSELGIHLDVGHDSIGWCVTEKHPGQEHYLAIPGTGVVLFPADDCLANKRREFRRQRRHIRATRQRIARMKALFSSLGVLTESEMNRNLTASPWKLAAEALNGRLLTWIELWCVLRWYAHNRGYDGNVLSSLRSGRQITEEDIKKNAEARDLQRRFGTESMAETMCKVLKIDPNGTMSSSMERFKGLGVSFDRTVVTKEVGRILEKNRDKLKGLNSHVVHLLMADPAKEPYCLRTEVLPFSVPHRYWGGILFGQLAPRFDNRIIGECPVSKSKLPLKATSEFLNFRFAMMLANVRVGEESRKLSTDEIRSFFALAKTAGGFQKRTFKEALSEIVHEKVSNADALLTAPEADESLILYPGLFALNKSGLRDLLPDDAVAKLSHRLFRGKRFTYAEIGAQLPPDRKVDFEVLIGKAVGKGRKKKSRQNVLESSIAAVLPSGRAPYSREVMRKATEAILRGEDPRERGGILYRDATKADALPVDKIDQSTNNHLIRHRVKILLRLLKDIVHDYAENNPARIAQVTVEMARDMKDMSGKTNKEVVQEMNLKVAHHNNAAKLLAKHLSCDLASLSPGMIRKVRIAEDMDWTCPYTGAKYDIQDVISRTDREVGVVDKDHILPRSQRVTDSLDSLVLTYTEVNRMKGARTALEFIREFGGKRVEGKENLVILNEPTYRKLVEGLKFDRFPDDRKRQKRRQEKLLKFHSDDAGMTDGMLSRTSFINTLALKAIRGFFANCGRMPRIVSIPGRVTAELRHQWNILGALAKIDPRIISEDGKLRLKQEIRGITHMHHAVDAITLGLAATLLPIDGTFYATMCKRRVSGRDADSLRSTGVFEVSAGGEAHLIELPDFLKKSIVEALSEQRVVVHLPQERNGLKLDLMTWGVEKVENGLVYVHQRSRNEKTGRIEIKADVIPESKAFGLNPKDGKGKLKAIKGILQTANNYGVALLDEPVIVRHQKVWHTVGGLRKDGKRVQMIRRGGLIEVAGGNYKGVWRVASVKDAKLGATLDLIRTYAIDVMDKMSAKRMVLVRSLVKSGLKVLKPRYTGIACPTISLTSQRKG